MSGALHSPDLVRAVQPEMKRLLSLQEPVLFSFFHGSAAEGRPFRDLDVAVYLEPAPDPFKAIVGLTMLLERKLCLPCDLHALNDAPAGFCYAVSRGQLLTCRDAELLADWREKSWNAYFRYLPHLRQHTQALLGVDRL